MATEEMDKWARQQAEKAKSDPTSAAALRAEQERIRSGNDQKMIGIAEKLINDNRAKLINGDTVAVSWRDLASIASGSDKTLTMLGIVGALKSKGYTADYQPGDQRDEACIRFKL